MYKSYHYDNMPRPVNMPASREVPVHKDKENEKKLLPLNGLIPNLKSDDIILLVIIFVLLIDDCEDKLLLIALGFIFFSGLGE